MIFFFMDSFLERVTLFQKFNIYVRVTLNLLQNILNQSFLQFPPVRAIDRYWSQPFLLIAKFLLRHLIKRADGELIYSFGIY
ncbi:hypothetical protein IPC453_02335 [Pseudomonas aeruginosa]|nr:hypothetical protein IPC1288_12800 [Pseudomonas aeruginosa]RQB42974.1 hypothetical protein IPC453_02335 [Pseudomonas aeruginosa]